MNVNVTETGPCRRQIEIRVEADAVEGRIAEQVREFKRTRAIPGFRPGRATDAVIRRRYGKAIRAEVLQDMIPEMWAQAITEQGLEPVGEPEIDEINAEPGEQLTITGEVDIKPQVEARDYKGLKATRRTRRIKDEDIDRQIEMMRAQRADELTVERPAQTGDVVVATVQALDEAGLPIIGRREEDKRWELGGSGSVSASMDEQLVGISVGETRNVAFQYREDLYDEARAGKDDKAAVTVSQVVERQLPGLDDDFAKDIGDFGTLDELKTAIREDLDGRTRRAGTWEVQRELREQVVKANQFDVPESLVTAYLERMHESHTRAQQGQEPDDTSKDSFFAEHRAEAMDRARSVLVLEMIAKQENLAVDDEKVDERIALMAAGQGMAPEEAVRAMRGSARYERIRSDLLDDAVMEFLESEADIEEVEIEDESESASE